MNIRKSLAYPLLLGSAIALALATSACSNGSAAPAAGGGPMPVSVATPVQRTVPIQRQFPGHVEATERVELRSRVTGYVRNVAFTEGDRVAKGQLLFEIDPAPFAANLAQAQAALREAQAESRLASRDAERAERLGARQAISASEAERRQAQAQVAQAKVASASAAVERAQLDLRYARIVAPIAGRIGRAEITAGNLVDASDRLGVIVADDSVYVSFDIDEASLAGTSPTQWTASFALPEQARPYTGKLAFVDNEVATGTGTLRARLRLPGDAALVPGRYGRVTLTMGERTDALLVDEKALASDQGSRYLLVVGADNTVQYRPVTAAERIGGYRVITSGLAADEQVVINGLLRVRPGMPVSPRSQSMAVAAGEEPAPSAAPAQLALAKE